MSGLPSSKLMKGYGAVAATWALFHFVLDFFVLDPKYDGLPSLFRPDTFLTVWMDLAQVLAFCACFVLAYVTCIPSRTSRSSVEFGAFFGAFIGGTLALVGYYILSLPFSIAFIWVVVWMAQSVAVSYVLGKVLGFDGEGVQ